MLTWKHTLTAGSCLSTGSPSLLAVAGVSRIGCGAVGLGSASEVGDHPGPFPIEPELGLETLAHRVEQPARQLVQIRGERARRARGHTSDCAGGGGSGS